MKKIVYFLIYNQFLLLIILLVIFCFFIFNFLFVSSNTNLKVYFLDVGQGDAIYVRSNTHDMLIDTGPGKNVLSELGRFMPIYDRKIDVVLITHLDKDHVGGLLDVLSSYSVDYLIMPATECDIALCEELEDFDIKRITAHAGLRINLGPDTLATVVFPNTKTEEKDRNTLSTVLRLEFGESSFLFMGDSPQKVEEYLRNKFGDFLHADVLKLGHHGSKTSSGEKFLDIVSPLYAIVSAGEGNSYGHPNKEVLDIVSSVGSSILSTLGGGAVVCEGFVNKNPVCN